MDSFLSFGRVRGEVWAACCGFFGLDLVQDLGFFLRGRLSVQATLFSSYVSKASSQVSVPLRCTPSARRASSRRQIADFWIPG